MEVRLQPAPGSRGRSNSRPTRREASPPRRRPERSEGSRGPALQRLEILRRAVADPGGTASGRRAIPTLIRHCEEAEGRRGNPCGSASGRQRLEVHRDRAAGRRRSSTRGASRTCAWIAPMDSGGNAARPRDDGVVKKRRHFQPFSSRRFLPGGPAHNPVGWRAMTAERLPPARDLNSPQETSGR